MSDATTHLLLPYILAAQAQPRSILEALADQQRQHLPPHLRDNPVLPRPTTDYHGLVEEATDHGSPSETHPDSVEPSGPDDDSGRPA